MRADPVGGCAGAGGGGSIRGAISERRLVLTTQGVVPVPAASATEVVPLHFAAAE